MSLLVCVRAYALWARSGGLKIVMITIDTASSHPPSLLPIIVDQPRENGRRQGGHETKVVSWVKLWAHSTPAQYTALLAGSWSPHKVSNSDGTFSTSERVQVRPTWLTVNAQGISLGRLERSCNARLSAIARLPVRSTKKSTEHRNGHLTPRTYSPFLTHRGIVGFRQGPNRPAFAQKLKGKVF